MPEINPATGRSSFDGNAAAQAKAGKRYGKRPSFNRCRITAILVTAVICQVSATNAASATLQRTTVQAWNRYYLWADAKVTREVKEPGKFLIQDRMPPSKRLDILRRIRSGEAYIEHVTGVIPENASFSVPDGEIHHWWGTILVPNVKIPQLMKFLQDYDHHAGEFADIVGSRLLSRDGEHFKISYRLMRSKAFVTAHYNTVQEATYFPIDSTHVWSKSVATKIAELENAGTRAERELPPGNDHGYLWRLVSWWRFQETGEGVVIELESASLSRDVPFMVRLIPGLSSYIRSTPKESMESILISILNHFK